MTDRALDDLARRVILDAARQEYGSLIAELPEQDFSPEFEKKMCKLVRRADHPIRHRVAKAAACFLLTALIGGGSILALVPEARAAFVGWIRDVYETWFVYQYEGERRGASEDTVFLPTWVPEGYEEIAPAKAGSFVRAQYENGANKLLTVSYVTGTQTLSLNVEWDGADVRRCAVNGLPADLYLNPEDGPNILVWTDGERSAAFWITAALGEDELVRIAESIRESEPMPRRYCVTWLPLHYGGYYVESETEEGGSGEVVYGNEQDFFITFGYSDDDAPAPRPETGVGAKTVHVDGRAAELYLSTGEGGDSVLIWPAAEGESVLWVRAPLPESELLQIAENVVVDLNRFSDLITIPVFDPEDAPLPELVERALSDASFITRVQEYARADAQTGVYMSEEYNAFVRDYQARHISPEREGAIARVSELIDQYGQYQGGGENILCLFGPFYTTGVSVGAHNTTAHIADERGRMIASYNSGYGAWTMVPTAEEMQFDYCVRQIYMEAYRAERASLAQD